MTRVGPNLVPFRKKDMESLLKIPEGKIVRNAITKPPSVKGNKLYHAVIEAAAMHWPENTEPWPNGDKELLRAWLQCSVSGEFRKTVDFPWELRDKVTDLIKDTLGDGKYAFTNVIYTNPTEPKFRVFIPHTTNFQEMPEDQRQKLRKGVFDIIEMTMKCTIETLMRGQEQAA